jgi:glycosyltransferase involved in cell wall biosynthesis
MASEFPRRNILFYHRIVHDDRSTHLIHVHELTANLIKLGYDVKFVEMDKIKQSSLPGITAIIYKFRNSDVRKFFLACNLLLKTKNRPDLIYMRHNLYDSGCILSKLFHIPIIIEVNGIVHDEMELWRNRNSMFLKFVDRLEKFNLNKANKLIVVTYKLKDILHNEYQIPLDRIVVIENGANVELFEQVDISIAKRKLNLDSNKRYICFVGSLSPHQGVEYLIKCAPVVLKKFPNICFLIVGNGKLKDELMGLAKMLGVEKSIIFTGMIPYENVNLYINSSEICIAPRVGLYVEKIGASPLKLCEYMACGKPVIASNISGIVELLKNSGGGITIGPENPNDLAMSIISLLRNDDLRRQMGELGYKYVIEHYSWRNVAKMVAETCENVLISKAET